MKRILISLAVIGTTLAIAFGFSKAFFNDTETSSGNLFQAGKFDLNISNECHYFQDGVDVGCGDNTSWEVDDLSGKVFFNFLDIKPGDYGESTIDFWIDNNPGWICSELTIVDQLENQKIESEITDEYPTQGELGKYLMWAWWRDDGDNVFETNETILNNGPKTVNNWLNNDFIDNALKIIIADSSKNWSQTPGPIPGGLENKEYLGFAWCFGDLVQNPQAPGDNDPTVNGTGFTCTPFGNENDSQTDSVIAQLKFISEQYRNNPDFRCIPETERLVDTVEVPSDGNQITSNVTLENRKNYKLVASGTYTYWPSCPETAPCIADAEYSLRPSSSFGPGWVIGDDVFPGAGYPAYSLDVAIHPSTNIIWGPLDITNHNYETIIPGNGSPITLFIYDSYYPDNSGAITIKIYEQL